MITLCELGGQNGRRYSLFSWRTRMALAPQGPRLRDAAGVHERQGGHRLFGRQDGACHQGWGDASVSDSWKIAEHLEDRYPQAPTLFGGAIGRGVTQALNTWVDRALVPAMLPVIVADIHERVEPRDDAFLREMFEKILKKPLEQTRAERDEALKRLGRALEPMQAALKRQPWVCGQQPAYADYILFSVFQWARVMSPQEVLGPEDPLCAWRERMLDLFGGFARNVPAA